MDLELGTLIDEIKQHWDSARRPAVGGPHYQRWDAELAAIFPEYAVMNYTDSNYGRCHHYQIMAHRGVTFPNTEVEDRHLIEQLGGACYRIQLELSAVLPYYRPMLIKRTLTAASELSGRNVALTMVAPQSAEQRGLMARVQAFAEQHGFLRFPEQYGAIVIPNMVLSYDRSPTIGVSVFDCLFHESPPDEDEQRALIV